MTVLVRWLIACTLAWALAAGASAHEPPKGIDLVWASDASEELPLIVANRGVVFADTVDDETRFSLRCVDSYGANISDRPAVFLEESGALTVGIYNAVYATSDRACSVQSSSGLPDESLSKVVRFPDAPNRMLLSTRTLQRPAGVFGSDDHGRSWSPRFENAVDETYDRLLIAPSDPQRVYAAGQRVDRVNKQLFHLCSMSLDAGETWEDRVLPAKIIPFAVHPSNADVLFAYQPTDNLETVYRVLRSEDRGVSFAPVLEGIPLPTSLTASPAAQLWLGVGGQGGLYRSTDDGNQFERVHVDSVQSVTCLIERRGRLWMCANMAPNTSGIWFSDDDGVSFEKLMTFEEVTHPVMCDDLEAQVLCSRPWYDFDMELHPPPLDAGIDAADAGLDPGGQQDAGAPNEEVDGADRGADAGTASRKRSSGCQLGMPGTSRDRRWGGGFGLMLLCWAWRVRLTTRSNTDRARA